MWWLPNRSVPSFPTGTTKTVVYSADDTSLNVSKGTIGAETLSVNRIVGPIVSCCDSSSILSTCWWLYAERQRHLKLWNTSATHTTRARLAIQLWCSHTALSKSAPSPGWYCGWGGKWRTFYIAPVKSTACACAICICNQMCNYTCMHFAVAFASLIAFGIWCVCDDIISTSS